jgi:hypothetical protein
MTRHDTSLALAVEAQDADLARRQAEACDVEVQYRAGTRPRAKELTRVQEFSVCDCTDDLHRPDHQFAGWTTDLIGRRARALGDPDLHVVQRLVITTIAQAVTRG